jgi:uncharacterized membrane-anchored protein
MKLREIWYKLRMSKFRHISRRKVVVAFYLVGLSLWIALYFGNIPSPLGPQLSTIANGSMIIGTVFAISTWIR